MLARSLSALIVGFPSTEDIQQSVRQKIGDRVFRFAGSSRVLPRSDEGFPGLAIIRTSKFYFAISGWKVSPPSGRSVFLGPVFLFGLLFETFYS